MKTVTVSIRLDEHLKTEVTTILADLGLSVNSAITMYFKQIVRDEGLPFKPSLNTKQNYQTNYNYDAIKEESSIMK